MTNGNLHGMKIVTQTDKMSRWARETRKAGKTIVLVPTMGALHAGHLALFREGRRKGDVLIVSIFVNPAQFNDPSDYERYPRELETDIEKCRKEKVDVVFAPAKDGMYPAGERPERILLPDVANVLEGPSRPGHFEGVVRIVSKLFRIVEPHVAIFGLKDYQQVRVIQEMVKGQKFPVIILSCPTVRTREGLALSSRNSRLSEQGREKALLISRTLKAAQYLVSHGEKKTDVILKKLKKGLMKEEDFRIDYLRIVDAETLEEIEIITRPALLAVAAFVEGVRLIDNCILEAV